MAEYIDIDGIIDAQLYDDEHEEWSVQRMTVRDYLWLGCDELPSAADVRPVVRSKWERIEVLYVTENPNNMPEAIVSMFCPECKRYHNEVFFYGNHVENVNFCCYCGADMR